MVRRQYASRRRAPRAGEPACPLFNAARVRTWLPQIRSRTTRTITERSPRALPSGVPVPSKHALPCRAPFHPGENNLV
jgi:hypothetical protein